MPAVPVSKSRRNPAATYRAWAEWLGRFRRSGQTVARFCAAEGVSEPSFYVWKRTPAGSSAGAPAVVPIRLTPSPTGIELALPSGAVVRFPADIRPELLVDIVRGLEGAAC